MKNKQTGVALVEFALILPLLLILTFVVTEYGRALYQYNILTKSVRDAARYLSMQTPGDTTKYSIAKNLVVYGNPAGSGSPLAIGLSTAQVADPVWQLTGASPLINTVTITIGFGVAGSASRYTFTPLFASAFGLSFGSVTYAPISATMRAPL
jgi:Flp pilus assembly protein TadG